MSKIKDKVNDKELKYNFIADMTAQVICVNNFVKVYGNKRLKPGEQDKIRFADSNGNLIRIFYKKLLFKDAIIKDRFYDDMDCWLEAEFGTCVVLRHNNINPLQLFMEPDPVVKGAAIGANMFYPLLWIESNELHEKINRFCEYVAEMKEV